MHDHEQCSDVQVGAPLGGQKVLWGECMTKSSGVELLHEALASGAEVVTDPRDICKGCIFFALKKHDSRTLSAALAWRLWGWLEYRGSFFLRLIDRVVTLLPELIAQKWKKLRAYRYNGSAFARYALETGAAAVVMDQGGVADKRVVRVPDARQALYCFARDHRLRQKVKVIGVTGSCGKTTTKEYIAHVLATHFKVVSTEGSFNTMLSTLAYSPCEPYGKRVKWRSLSH